MRRGDDRVAGFYEPSVRVDDRFDLTRSLARSIGSLAGLDVRGRCRRGGRLLFGELRDLAGSDRLADFDARTIELIDLLRFVRADADAELVVFDTLDHGAVALRIDQALRSGSTSLVLGGDEADGGGAPSWNRPIELRSSDVVSDHPIRVVRLTFTTVSEHVGVAP